jgi:carboxy-terminal domain RNA polymerase II polypeptide A small phosphatase
VNENIRPAAEKKKILVIFDLDETLIHATKESLARKEDFMIGEFHVYKRPFLDFLLLTLSRCNSLAIWSSGTSLYVNTVVEKIRPRGIKFEFTWSREKCTQRFDPDYNDYFYAKKLEKVENLGFAKERILIVEDLHRNVSLNYGNAVLVKPYAGDEDNELELLCKYLASIGDISDVRPIEKRGWRSKVQGLNPDL